MRIRRPSDLGALARQRRLDQGLSQDALAEKAGVTRQWLIRFEHGGGDVTVSKAFAVLDALDLATVVEPRSQPRATSTPRISVDLPDSTVLAQKWADLARQLGSTDRAELRRRAQETRRSAEQGHES